MFNKSQFEHEKILQFTIDGRRDCVIYTAAARFDARSVVIYKRSANPDFATAASTIELNVFCNFFLVKKTLKTMKTVATGGSNH